MIENLVPNLEAGFFMLKRKLCKIEWIMQK